MTAPATGRPAAQPDCRAGAGEWACQRCGLAFFGIPPEHELCPDCLADGGSQ